MLDLKSESTRYQSRSRLLITKGKIQEEKRTFLVQVFLLFEPKIGLSGKISALKFSSPLETWNSNPKYCPFLSNY
jgi:hypothetical protein